MLFRSVYAGMVGQNGLLISPEFAWKIKSLELAALAIGIALVLCEGLIRKRSYVGRIPVLGISRASVASVGLSCLTAVAIFKLSADTYSPFLYFQF